MKKTIGVIMSKPYKDTNRGVIQGVIHQSYLHNYRVVVLCIKEENVEEALQGELNLLNLIHEDAFDGIVYMRDTIQPGEIHEDIENYLSEHFHKPIVAITEEDIPMDTTWLNDSGDFFEITNHLIREHNCKNILCLTGPKDRQVSLKRLKGFEFAMKQANLPCDENNVVFGDFWINSAITLANEIASGVRPMPDAIVCGNDLMAVSLYDAFTQNGINASETIRIIGYDGTEESWLHHPSISTYRPAWKNLGERACVKLIERIENRIIEMDIPFDGMLLCRSSCGCKDSVFAPGDFDYLRFERTYLDTQLATSLFSENSVNGLIHKAYSLTYYFSEQSAGNDYQLRICLCDDWDKIEKKGYERIFRTEGFSETMRISNWSGEIRSFKSKDICPEFCAEDFGPNTVTYVNSLHFQSRIFGYNLLTFYNQESYYTQRYVRYVHEINQSLEFLSVQNELKSQAYQTFLSGIRDVFTGLYRVEGFPELYKEVLESATMNAERIYLIGIQIAGLEQIKESMGALEQDKLISYFGEILHTNNVVHGKIIRTDSDDFIVVGSEVADENEHTELFSEKMISNIEQQFQQYCQDSCYPFVMKLRYVKKYYNFMEKKDGSEICAELLLALSELEKQPFIRTLGSYYPQLVQLRKEIYNNPGLDWNATLCCDRIGLSKAYYHKIYLKTFDINCTEDIIRIRINHAKKLLSNTTMSLMEIASTCGFEYTHFTRTFKKVTGVNPSRFRKGSV